MTEHNIDNMIGYQTDIQLDSDKIHLKQGKSPRSQFNNSQNTMKFPINKDQNKSLSSKLSIENPVLINVIPCKRISSMTGIHLNNSIDFNNHCTKLSNKNNTIIYENPPSNNLTPIVKPVCKICYEAKSLDLGNLLEPCKCTGSMRYIHEKCLKAWLENNGNIFECEICKFRYFVKLLLKKKYSKSKCRSLCNKLIAVLMFVVFILIIVSVVMYYLIIHATGFTDEKRKFIIMLIVISLSVFVFLIIMLILICDLWRRSWVIVNDGLKIFNIHDGK